MTGTSYINLLWAVFQSWVRVIASTIAVGPCSLRSCRNDRVHLGHGFNLNMMTHLPNMHACNEGWLVGQRQMLFRIVCMFVCPETGHGRIC